MTKEEFRKYRPYLLDLMDSALILVLKAYADVLREGEPEKESETTEKVLEAYKEQMQNCSEFNCKS